MKRWDTMLVLTVCLILLLTAGTNVVFWIGNSKEEGRLYRVEANRVVEEIKQHGLSHINLSQYETIIAVVPLMSSSEDEKSFFEGEGNDYLIRKVGDTLYRIEYQMDAAYFTGDFVLAVNLILFGMGVLLLAILFYVRQNVLMPFVTLREVPYELSKGNLTVPLKENRSRFFGRFVWGLDLLREHLEEQKQRELNLHKEKKTLVLSISHDIKTPLSAIKLYAGALSRGLYPEKEKQNEIAENINQKADEIENFVSQIVQASREDFLQFEVIPGEFYLAELLSKLKEYYRDKQELLRIPFNMGAYSDCLLKGDLDRSVEVLQNIVENAMKYGDGQVLRIEMARETDCQLVTILNSGCQLKEHELPCIFESFWRGSNVKNNHGSGLGLYICRQLMRKMDGEVYAELQGDMMSVTVVFRMA